LSEAKHPATSTGSGWLACEALGIISSTAPFRSSWIVGFVHNDKLPLAKECLLLVTGQEAY
jgi:hypothetical protein